MDIATAATLGATAVTLAWFIRDMKRENTKVLKRIEEGQEGQSRLITEGLSKLSEDNVTIAKILERIESNTIKT